MLVYAALWGHCDSQGVFVFNPRLLKLDILPFLPFEMARTLQILTDAELIIRFSVNGKEYGKIESFLRHQRLSGKEATEGEKYPDINSEATGKQSGSIEEIPESQEGKGKEGNISNKSDCIDVLNYLNAKTGKQYRPVDANLKLVSARLKEGATIDECKAVIDAKVKEWSDDPKFQKYLRPATLFSAENFAQYVGQIGSQEKGPQWE